MGFRAWGVCRLSDALCRFENYPLGPDCGPQLGLVAYPWLITHGLRPQDTFEGASEGDIPDLEVPSWESDQGNGSRFHSQQSRGRLTAAAAGASPLGGPDRSADPSRSGPETDPALQAPEALWTLDGYYGQTMHFIAGIIIFF